MVMAYLLSVIRYRFMFSVCFKGDVVFLNSCLVENLQETACGGSVLSTGCGRSSDLLQLYLFGEMITMKNYWRMRDFSLFSVPYVYVDHNSYLADQLFVQNKVLMKFKGEMARKDSPYCIIFCKVRKRDVERFEDALGRLENKMLLLGHGDYSDVCGEIERMIDEGKRALQA